MSFNQFKLDIASVQTRGIFNTYVYQTETDTTADVQAPGYFAQSRFELVDGDGCGALIRCCCSDGFFEGFVDASGTITPIHEGSAVSKKEVSTPYTVLSSDEILFVSGTGTVTVPSGLDGKTLYSVDGFTLSPVPANVPAVIPAGQSYTLYWRSSTSEYLAL